MRTHTPHTHTCTHNHTQAHPHTRTHPHRISWQVLTTICACGKCRAKTETVDGKEDGGEFVAGAETEAVVDVKGASAVLEPYLWHRLVLAFYLFSPFVCFRCLLATHSEKHMKYMR